MFIKSPRTSVRADLARSRRMFTHARGHTHSLTHVCTHARVHTRCLQAKGLVAVLVGTLLVLPLCLVTKMMTVAAGRGRSDGGIEGGRGVMKQHRGEREPFEENRPAPTQSSRAEVSRGEREGRKRPRTRPRPGSTGRGDTERPASNPPDRGGHGGKPAAASLVTERDIRRDRVGDGTDVVLTASGGTGLGKREEGNWGRLDTRTGCETMTGGEFNEAANSTRTRQADQGEGLDLDGSPHSTTSFTGGDLSPGSARPHVQALARPQSKAASLRALQQAASREERRKRDGGRGKRGSLEEGGRGGGVRGAGIDSAVQAHDRYDEGAGVFASGFQVHAEVHEAAPAAGWEEDLAAAVLKQDMTASAVEGGVPARQARRDMPAGGDDSRSAYASGDYSACMEASSTGSCSSMDGMAVDVSHANSSPLGRSAGSPAGLQQVLVCHMPPALPHPLRTRAQTHNTHMMMIQTAGETGNCANPDANSFNYPPQQQGPRGHESSLSGRFYAAWPHRQFAPVTPRS